MPLVIPVSTLYTMIASRIARRLARASVLLAVVGVTLPAQQTRTSAPRSTITQGSARKLNSVEGITEYQLTNGMRVLLFPDPSKPTVTVNITYLVGSRHEGYGETGMAHLLEHLVFKGTPTHKDIPAEMTAHGANFNGTTFLDRTNYYETVEATEANIDWALAMEADRMVNSNIAREDLEKEFTVVRNEFEAGENDPFGVLLERVQSTAFLWHNYGNSTIGARADIENVPIERLKAFYRRYYQPDNAILVVAGKFDEAAMLQKITRRFGSIPKPVRSLANANLLYPTYTRDPVQDGERSVTLRRVGEIAVAAALYHTPAVAHPDFAAVSVLGEVLGDAPSGRIYQATVEQKKATSAGAFGYQTREPGFLAGFVQTRKDQSIDEARGLLQRAMEGTITTPPTAEEVDRAKTALLKNIDLGLNDAQRVGLELTEWAASGDWRLLFLHRDRIKAVTPADVQRVAAAYLKPTNVTLGTFIPTEKPDRAEIPEAPEPEEALKNFKGSAVVATGEAFDPTPANIDARTQRRSAPNGFRIQLLPKSTRGNTVVATINLRYGTAQSLTNRATAAAWGSMLIDRGMARLNRQQLKDAFDKLKARVSVDGSPGLTSVDIETTRPNLSATLALVAEMIMTPTHEEGEFKKAIAEALAQLEASRKEPQALASQALNSVMNPYPKGHPLYAPTIDENIAMLNALTVEDVRKTYAEFAGASNGDITVVGDFAPDSVATQVTKLFGEYRSKQPWARMVRTMVAAKANEQTIETPDKANAIFVAATSIPMADDDPDYAALTMANAVLGGGSGLDNRMMTRLRQKDGVSYGAGTQFSARPVDKVAQFIAFAIYAPENLEKVSTGYREEMARLIKDGITQEELDKARTGVLQQRLQARAADQGLVGSLAGNLYWGRTMAFDAAFDAKLKALTPAQVNAAITKYIAPAQFAVVRAGDYAGAAKKKAATPAVKP
jgi:zinc protease